MTTIWDLSGRNDDIAQATGQFQLSRTSDRSRSRPTDQGRVYKEETRPAGTFLTPSRRSIAGMGPPRSAVGVWEW